jgi:hypothetical protein
MPPSRMAPQVLAGLVTVLVAFSPALPQREATPAAAARQEAALGTALRQVLSPSGIRVPERPVPAAGTRAQELRFVWDPAPRPDVVPASAAGLRVASRVRDAGAFPRLRSLELADDQVLLAAVDATGGLRGWSVIPDPRIVRIEVPGPDGVLTGQTLILPRAEFLAPIPDDPLVTEVRVFQTRRSGDGYQLEPVATLVVPRAEGRR